MSHLKFAKAFAITALLSVFFTTSLVAQKDIKPLRIGLKLGTPIIAGLNLEYVTPLLENRLSADAEFSYFPLSIDETELSYTTLALGANYYFTKPGRGLYGGLAYGSLILSAKETLTSTEGGVTITGEGEGSLTYTNLNLKIGGKHGGGFYFRWELGYALPLSSGDLIVEAEATGGGQTETLREEVSIPFTGLPIVNIGFGVAF